MPANENFHFFDALGHRRTLDAVMDTVDGMESAEALYLLNAVRALDSLNEAVAANAESEASTEVLEIVEELTAHIAAVALDIHRRED